MRVGASSTNRRILIVDDNEDIHHDFRRILEPAASTSALAELDALEAEILGETSHAPPPPAFELSSAFQGAEALGKVQQALKGGAPYALAFVDVRMPPGWDGIETLQRLWQVDPSLQAVVCSAYSDYSWESINARLGQTDRLLILKKPFDAAEVRQIACALVEKWNHSQTTLHTEQALRRSEAQLRERLDAQAAAMAALSVPLVPLTEEILLLPLVGPMDANRLERVRETLVAEISGRHSRVAILDVTGVSGLCPELIAGLVGTARAVRRAGAEVSLTGLRPDAVPPLMELGRELGGVTTHTTLPGAVAFAMGGH